MTTQSSTEQFGHTVQDELVAGIFSSELIPEPEPDTWPQMANEEVLNETEDKVEA